MKNTPILSSFARLLLLPIILWQLFEANAGAASALLLVSGLLGLVHSGLARGFQGPNRMDEALDPIVETLTQAMVCLLLAFQEPEYWWMFAAILAMDMLMLAFGSSPARRKSAYGAIWATKLCNVLFCAAMAPVLMDIRQPPWLLPASSAIILASMAASTLCSLPWSAHSLWRRLREGAGRLRRMDGTLSESGLRIYGLFSIGVIPLCTIAFASQGDPLAVNLSIIGNQPGHRAWFILWGILCAAFFLALFGRTFALAGYTGKTERALLFIACISFIACVLTPFLPERYPRAASWHNRLAVLASALIILVSFLLTLHLRRVDHRLCRDAVLLWLGMTCVSALLMGTTGISGLFETVLIIWCCLHTYHILVQLNKRLGPEASRFEKKERYAAK